MITNFEDHTTELTKEEIALLPALLKGLSRRAKDDPIHASGIIDGMNTYIAKNGMKTKFTDVRLRKMVNYIRLNGIAPVIATQKGYFISQDPDEIQKQIESLEQRARSQIESANGLRKYISQR